MSPYEYLREQAEKVPIWLADFRCGNIFPRQAFFGSRVVYYPGSGSDGHPVKIFGSTHSAHCFVYADCGVSQATLEAQLGQLSYGFRGYHKLDRLQVGLKDLIPGGWFPHVDGARGLRMDKNGLVADTLPFGFVEVMERDQDLDDSFGARRLAILFLCSEAVATYDALFCQPDSISGPFAVVLQDHGFGGNSGSFGHGGLLEQVAIRFDVVPPWQLVAENTRAWSGFERVPNVSGDSGGMHNNLRFLHRRSKDPGRQKFVG